MNTLDYINTVVLSSLGQPILKEVKPVEHKELKPITFTVNVDPKYVVFKDPKKAEQLEYISPSIEIEEKDNTIIEKPKKTIKKTTKAVKPKKVVKSSKNK